MNTDLPITAAPAVPLSFNVDTEEEFFARRVPGAAVPGQEGEQGRVRRLLAALKEIWMNRETEGVNPAAKRLARTMQMPWGTLRRLYYGYTRGVYKAKRTFAPGDWRSVLNWSKVREADNNLPFAFCELWRTLGEQNQRCWKPAYAELMNIVRTRFGFPHGTTPAKFYDRLPGFSEWPQIPPGAAHPPGMSYDNLMRHTSDPFETSLARHGRAKASAWRVPVLKTRVGLRIGQYVEFDDHDFNQKIMFQQKPQRPSGFGAIDVLTSCMATVAFKPNLWDFVEEKRLVLTEREFMWFVIAHLTTVGVRTDDIGTTLIVERAKAAIREPFRSRLLASVRNLKIYDGGQRDVASNNGAKPGRLASFARPAHDGQWRARAKGNFRTKALIESFWNPVDNQTAHLIGQMGKDRDHAPAQLHGMEQYTAQLVRQITDKNIPLERAALVEFPFLTFHQWRELAQEGIMRLNRTPEHNCEGWEKLGFERVQWRESEDSPDWMAVSDLELLSEVRREILSAKIKANQALTRSVRLSRWEAFQSLRRELAPLSVASIPELVGVENALGAGELMEVGKTKPGLFVFECDEIEPGPIEFYAKDERGFLRNGDKYVCFVNPCAPRQLIACDEKLRVKAVCPRLERASLADPESMQRAMGVQGSYEAAAKMKLNLRHDDAARAIREMRERNTMTLTPPAPPKISRADREAFLSEETETTQ